MKDRDIYFTWGYIDTLDIFYIKMVIRQPFVDYIVNEEKIAKQLKMNKEQYEGILLRFNALPCNISNDDLSLYFRHKEDVEQAIEFFNMALKLMDK